MAKQYNWTVWRGAALLGMAAILAACGSPSAHVGVGVPVGPVSVGVGLGSGGVSAGVFGGVGPVGAGVGVNQRGQVTGGAGVGASVPVGNASVGVGVGSSTVLHDPQRPASAPPAAPQPAPAAPGAPLQWRDAQGRPVPECRVMGGC